MCWACHCTGGTWDIALSWNWDSSAAQQSRRAIFRPFVHTTSMWAFCNDLTTWSVLQHNWCKLEAITAFRFAQSMKTDLKCFLEGGRLSQIIKYFDSLAENRPTLMLLIILTSQSSSANLKLSLCLFLFSSFLWKQPLERHIFLL